MSYSNANGDIYKENFWNDSLVRGYKGDSYMNAGYIYAPYIPLQGTTPVVSTPPQTPNPYKILWDEAVTTELPSIKPVKKYRSIEEPWQPSME